MEVAILTTWEGLLVNDSATGFFFFVVILAA